MSRHHLQSHPTVAASKGHDAPREAASSAAEPTHDEIAGRAYDIYLKTGSKQGQCEHNWQQAEQSLHEQGCCQAKSSGTVAGAAGSTAAR